MNNFHLRWYFSNSDHFFHHKFLRSYRGVSIFSNVCYWECVEIEFRLEWKKNDSLRLKIKFWSQQKWSNRKFSITIANTFIILIVLSLFHSLPFFKSQVFSVRVVICCSRWHCLQTRGSSILLTPISISSQWKTSFDEIEMTWDELKTQKLLFIPIRSL